MPACSAERDDEARGCISPPPAPGPDSRARHVGWAGRGGGRRAARAHAALTAGLLRRHVDPRHHPPAPRPRQVVDAVVRGVLRVHASARGDLLRAAGEHGARARAALHGEAVRRRPYLLRLPPVRLLDRRARLCAAARLDVRPDRPARHHLRLAAGELGEPCAAGALAGHLLDVHRAHALRLRLPARAVPRLLCRDGAARAAPSGARRAAARAPPPRSAARATRTRPPRPAARARRRARATRAPPPSGSSA